MTSLPAAIVHPAETVLIYARVSYDPKYKGDSVDRQIELGTQWATLNGYGIGRIIRDDNRSASRHAKRTREGWERVKEIIAEPKRPETILWTREDTRATREMGEFVTLRDLFKDHDMLWSINGRMVDFNRSGDRLTSTITMAMAEHEVEQTIERASGGIMSAAEQGKPRGRTPYGYVRVYRSDRSSKLLVHDPEALVIKEAADRFASGESLHAIAKDFQAREIPTPVEAQSAKESNDPKVSKHGWREYMIRRLLTNPVINGKRKLTLQQGHGKPPLVTINDGDWDAIVDDITFRRVRDRFDDPSRKTMRQREATRILTGVARCGVCDGPLGFSVKRYKDGRERGIYSCRYGNHVQRHQGPLEAMASEAIIDYMRRNDIGNDDPAPELLAARERIEFLKAKIVELTDLMGTGDYDAREFMNSTKGLREQIAKIERSIQIANVPTVAIDMASADDPEVYWESLQGSPELRRAILRATLRVIVHPVTKPGSKVFDRDTIDIRPV